MTLTNDVNVVLMDFKSTKPNEMVTVNEDGSYTIFINSRLSHNRQLESYKHAIKHIENDDFHKTDIQSIEHNAHSSMIKELPETVVAMPDKEYQEKMERLKRQRKRIQRKIKEDEERVQFLIDYTDMFSRAESQYLYGNEW